ncbi:MAG: SDR family oxidoreductase, partial [Caldilineaceae bacterium]|nr:SDR family oxidoreductase [Caldilineaceae bacterium]
AVAGMIERGHGRIINIASIAGKVGTLHGAAYAASKHGLLGLTRTLAMEVVRAGVTVNAVCPGPVESLMNDKRIAYDAQRLGITVEEFEAGITPLGRRLVPAEIASMARFLAGPDAAAITGQAYNVDGGLVTA